MNVTLANVFKCLIKCASDHISKIIIELKYQREFLYICIHHYTIYYRLNTYHQLPDPIFNIRWMVRIRLTVQKVQNLYNIL